MSIRAQVVTRWEAGDLGCSALIIGLKRRLTRLEFGDVLEVVARDPGARIDLFVWCRMTGNRLLSEQHPVYRIQRTVASVPANQL